MIKETINSASENQFISRSNKIRFSFCVQCESLLNNRWGMQVIHPNIFKPGICGAIYVLKRSLWGRYTFWMKADHDRWRKSSEYQQTQKSWWILLRSQSLFAPNEIIVLRTPSSKNFHFSHHCSNQLESKRSYDIEVLSFMYKRRLIKLVTAYAVFISLQFF
jgi:hypothetical protein